MGNVGLSFLKGKSVMFEGKLCAVTVPFAPNIMAARDEVSRIIQDIKINGFLRDEAGKLKVTQANEIIAEATDDAGHTLHVLVKDWETAIIEKLKNKNLSNALKQDLATNAAFKQLIQENEDLVTAWEVFETAGLHAKRVDAAELQKLSKIIKDNNLSLNSAVDAVRTAATRTIPAALASKLSQAGTSRLSTWLTGKSLRYVDEAGTVFTGANAEARILDKLNTQIGDNAVLDVLEDTRGRFLVQSERGAQTHKVVSVEKNITGNYVVHEYKPTYKSTANTNINADLSVNKLCQDYTTHGGIYLYPQSAMTNGQRNVVEITMTGNMTRDFRAANAAAGFASWGDDAPALGQVQYTWHHMDDFNPATGKCTMQLVDQAVHTRVTGMAHSGGVAQYQVYKQTGY
jgi:hypothetical protein